ncbi:MAG TPA: macro domain-containing protein [Longimicrobiales bacterium]|nr:macro domain-containing protein [Longimicrobiales bacterium]
MIEVCVGDAWSYGTAAVLRPIASDGSAPTPAVRRLELAAGPQPAEQYARLGELPVGSAVITGAGDLPVEYLIHVVVRSPEEPVTTAGVVRGLLNGLRRVEEWALESVAIMPLGTGAGNLDVERAAAIMAPVLIERAATPEGTRIVIAVESEYERDVFLRALGIQGVPAGEEPPPMPH